MGWNNKELSSILSSHVSLVSPSSETAIPCIPSLAQWIDPGYGSLACYRKYKSRVDRKALKRYFGAHRCSKWNCSIIDVISSDVPSCRQATISGSKPWQFIKEQENQFLDQTTFVLGLVPKAKFLKKKKKRWSSRSWYSHQPSRAARFLWVLDFASNIRYTAVNFGNTTLKQYRSTVL